MNKLVIGFLLAFLFTGEALNAQSKNGLKNSNQYFGKNLPKY